MGALIHRISGWDGVPLLAREWEGDARRAPLLCLPGLVRTSEDFTEFVATLGDGRRAVSLDYVGRGGSGRSAAIARYAPEACLRDVLDVCAALHVRDAIVVGTSFGGLLGMGLAAARPSLLRALVLNDIGPEVGSDGAAFVRTFVGTDPAHESLAAAAAWLRESLSFLSLSTEAEWLRMAELTYTIGPDRRFHPSWDIRIAELLGEPAPDLWPLFGGLAHVPLLLVRGEASTILLPDVVARMRALRPDMAVASLPNVGHAPTLTEPALRTALRQFLERIA